MKNEEKYSQKAKVKNVQENKPLQIVQHELFNIIKGPQGYFLAVQNKIVSSKTFKSVEEAKKYINSKPWELLVNVSCICFDIMNENKEQNKQ